MTAGALPPRGPEEAAVRAVVALARAAREAGLRTGVDAALVLAAALAEIDARRRQRVYWAARAALVRDPAEVRVFDTLFERWWEGLTLELGPGIAEHGESDPRMPSPQHGGESLPQFRLEGRSERLLGDGGARAAHELPLAAAADPDGSGGERHGALAAWSPDETVAPPEPLDLHRDELAAVQALAAALRKARPERETRRLRPGRHGRPDLRRTVRASLRTEGEPVRIARVTRARAPRRLLFLCDVSGSMERHARALLAALGGAVRSGTRVEAFAFATRLTRLTPVLRGADVVTALEHAREEVEDWSGGTRIGAVLGEFNRTHARRGLARGALAVIVSDGWDRGDPDELAREVERLRRQCRRLIWMNPRPGGPQDQPLAVGMRAALPWVDDFVAGHDATAFDRLVRVIAELGGTRPARRQRPIRLEAT